MSKSVKKEDNLIIKKILKGDESILEQLYLDHYPLILNFIIKNSGNEEEAKDIFQESILVFYNKVKEKKLFLTCSISTYIYSVARHLWLNELKSKSRNQLNIEELETYIVIDEDEKKEIKKKEDNLKLMNDSLERLGDPCKSILYDFYIAKLRMEEIAQKMQYTNAANAKNQKYKCLQRLKKIFFESSKTK